MLRAVDHKSYQFLSKDRRKCIIQGKGKGGPFDGSIPLPPNSLNII